MASHRRIGDMLAVPLLVVLAGLLTTACAGGADGEVKVRLVTPAAKLANGSPDTRGGTSTPFPNPEIILSTDTAPQAGTILVSVTGPVASGWVTFLKRSYTLTKGSQSMYAFVAVDADDPPGRYPLTVSYALPNGSKGSLADRTITVVATSWTVDSVVVGPELTLLLDPAVADAESAQLASIYAHYTPTKIWTTGWIRPTAGPLTTAFGEERSYNGSPPAGHHGGADIGAELGTPVVATNGGRVVLARQLRVRGNMIILDHGGGLFSGYAHLSRFAVAEGQQVAQGDLIGYVGSTGVSTGAHLHWEMAVGGVPVDATRFVDGSNGF